MADKRSMEKKIIINRYINTLLPVDSSAATTIAYILVMLLIERRNFRVKQSE